MNKNFRFLHVADTHLGYDGHASLHHEYKALRIHKNVNHLNIRTHDVNESFRQVVDIALDREVNMVLHSGDGLDKWGFRQPHIFNFYMEQVKRATEKGIYWVEIVGNHNFSKREGIGNELYKLGLLDRVYTTYDGFYEQIELPDFPVCIHNVPSTYNNELFKDELSRVERKEGVYNIGNAHCGVSLIDHYAKNHNRTIVVSLNDLLSTKMDYFGLGDYHDDIDFGHNIRYAGATERFGLGEAHCTPKVFIQDIDLTTYERVETPVPLKVRDMIDLEPIDASSLLANEEEEVDALLHEIDNRLKGKDFSQSIVRLRIKQAPQHLLPFIRAKEEQLRESILFFKLEPVDIQSFDITNTAPSDMQIEGVLEGLEAYAKQALQESPYDVEKIVKLGEKYLAEELDEYEAN